MSEYCGRNVVLDRMDIYSLTDDELQREIERTTELELAYFDSGRPAHARLVHVALLAMLHEADKRRGLAS